MAKFRGIQIRDGAITSTHLVTGITVNGITLSGSAANQHTFAVLNSVGLEGTAGSYNLDSFLIKSGGTVSGSLTVTGSLTVSGGVVVPSGTTLLIGPALSGTDLIQALSGIDAGVTATKLIQLTNTSTVTGHTHTTSSLSIKEEHMLTKVATSGTDYITLDFGTASNLSLPTGNGAVSSDIEAFINGQLLEYNESVGFSLSGSDVKFNPAISGDHLAVIWRALGSSGGGGGGSVQETITLSSRLAIEQDLNSEFLPFTETDFRHMIKIAQASTWGTMPTSHYSDWLVHGKNLAKDILMRTSGSYFGVPTKLQGIFSGTSWTTGTASKNWVLEFIAFCASWAWKIQHPLLPTVSGNNYNRLYKWETWDYLVEYLKPWSSYYVSDGWANTNQPEVSVAQGDMAGTIPNHIRLHDLTWSEDSKAGGQPFNQDIEINRLTVFGDVLATNGANTNKLIVRTEWEGTSSDFGGSTTIRSNEAITTYNNAYYSAGLSYSGGVATVTGSYAANNTLTPVYVGAGQVWQPGNFTGPAVTQPAYHVATVSASDATSDIALTQNASEPLPRVDRIRHVVFKSAQQRPYVRLGFVPEGLAMASERARYGQSLAMQAQYATSSSRQLLAKHILSLYPLNSGSLTMGSIDGSYYYDNPLENDPNWIPLKPELTSRYPTISGITFSGSTYSPSSIPIKTGTYKAYTHGGGLIGFHPYLGNDILSYLWGNNESIASGSYMIDGFLGDNYTIVM